jgi:hypothetical protein
MNRLAVVLAMLIMLAVVAGCSATTATVRPAQQSEEYLCADGIATVYVWEDLNGNGLRDDEPGLAGVVISVGGESGVTDTDGLWRSGLVVGACGSSDEVRASMDAQCQSLCVSASPPPGYAPTTENGVYGCNVRFGFRRANTPSPPATAQATRTEGETCADGIVVAFAWVDDNGNGYRDACGEPPLAGVVISVDDQSGVTGAGGKWASGFIFRACGSPDEVRASMAEQCWNLSVSASPPRGYRPTRVTTAPGCDVQFGFQQVYVPPQ